MAGVDSDTSVTARMAGQRKEGNPGGDLIEFLGRGKPAPLLAMWVVLNDVGFVGPLSRPVAEFLSPRRRPDCSEGLGDGDVDLCVREVGKTTDVIHVKVCDDDMADIVSTEGESFDLMGDRLLGAEDRSDDVSGRSDAPRGFGAVV